MSRIIVEYQPNISHATKDIIRKNLGASMISADESSSHYEISSAELILEEQGDLVDKQDLQTIRDLMSQGVHYIEF